MAHLGLDRAGDRHRYHCHPGRRDFVMRFRAWFTLTCLVMLSLAGCVPPTSALPLVEPSATQVPTPTATLYRLSWLTGQGTSSTATLASPAGQEGEAEMTPTALAWPVSTEGYATPEPGLAVAAFESEVTM
jgi:hypothetical protein